jgi:hypothetical protein
MMWLFLLGFGHSFFSASPSESWMMRNNEHVMTKNAAWFASASIVRCQGGNTSAQGENIPGYTV